MCPNCGTTMPFRNDMCQACFWDEDSEHFCPHWMQGEDWQAGMASNWEYAAKKKRKTKKEQQYEKEIVAWQEWQEVTKNV